MNFEVTEDCIYSNNIMSEIAKKHAENIDKYVSDEIKRICLVLLGYTPILDTEEQCIKLKNELKDLGYVVTLEIDEGTIFNDCDTYTNSIKFRVLIKELEE